MTRQRRRFDVSFKLEVVRWPAGARDQFGASMRTIAQGRVYVGATNGAAMFGLLK